jgi:phosphohistidine phosphatase
MTKQNKVLILMRHAKSDWSDDSLTDHERRLNERGRAAAPAMAQWLQRIELVPDVILSSSSTRTRETVDLMKEEWASEPVVTYNELLYLATPSTIMEVAKAGPSDAQRLMIVAHNPGMTSLVSMLSGQQMDMPTAAIAIFELEAGTQWSDLLYNTPLKLIHFMRPKAL